MRQTITSFKAAQPNALHWNPSALNRRASPATGYPGFHGAQAALGGHHEPEVFRSVAKVLLTKDYVRLRIGDGARSKYWGRVLSSAFGRPLTYRDASEVGAAYGAARLARLGYADEPVEKVCTAPPVLQIIEPDPTLAEGFAAKTVRYRALYRALKPSFKEIA